MPKIEPPNPVAEAVVKTFGLEDLSAGRHHLAADGHYVEIDSIWIIEFPFYFHADIYVAGVNQVKWIPQDNDTARASDTLLPLKWRSF